MQKTVSEEIEILKKECSEYVWWYRTIKKSLIDNTVVGINCAASSILRKPFTLERINDVIKKNKLNLKVVVFDNTARLKITEK